jgi:SSS family solute:Na+ symporter
MTSLIILLYLAIVLIVGLAFSWRRDRSTEDYFYGGRTTGTIALGSSLVLSNTLRYLIVLLPLAALQSLWVAVAVSIGAVIVSYRVRFPQSTGPELNDVCGSKTCRWFINLLILLFYVTIQIAGLLVLAQMILGSGLNQEYSITVLLMIVFAGIFAVVGGFSAVAHTQALHTVVFLAGLLGLVLLKAVPSPGTVLSALVPEKPVSLEGAILGLPVVSLWIWHYDQASLQQVRSSKDAGTLHRGLLVAGGIAMIVAAVLFVGATSSAGAPSVLQTPILLPVCLAVLMASFSASFTSAAAMVSNELFKSLKPESTDQELILVGRLATATIAGLTIIMIPMVQTIGSRLLDLFVMVQISLFPPVTALYAARLMFKSFPLAGALPALVAGEIVGIVWILLHAVVPDPASLGPVVSWFFSMDHFLFAFCLFCFSLLVLYGAGAVAGVSLKTANRLT